MKNFKTLTYVFLCVLVAFVVNPSSAFESPRYVLRVALPADWKVLIREEEDRVFVARIDQADPERPGVAACELGLAPENLEEYRTRIEGNARRGAPGKLV